MKDTDCDADTVSFPRKGSVPLIELVDSLTGLPGRKAAFAMLARAVMLASRTGKHVLTALVDIDRFYIINETRGTAFGDEALRQFARRLRNLKLWSSHAHRLYGNTFLLIRLVDSASEMQEDDALIQELKHAVEELLTVRGQSLYPFCSIGVSRYPADGNTAELIVRHADTALQQAKAAGGNQISSYAVDGMAQVNRLEELRSSLRHALAANALTLHYQPLYEATGELRGFEALLRWRHPKLGDISPAEFIPLAEQSGQIIKIGEWVLGEACRMLGRAQARGLQQLVMSVNLSPLQLRAPGFVEALQRILEQTETKPECLELEITESMMIDADDNVNTVLYRLRGIGFRIALDDFGVGYASLTYLRKLPLHTLKLDRSFIRHIGEQSAEHVIVRSMISLVHQLGFEVVAEGVETVEQFRLLREWGCNFYQGYLLAGPLEEESVGVHLLEPDSRLFHPPSGDLVAVMQC